MTIFFVILQYWKAGQTKQYLPHKGYLAFIILSVYLITFYNENITKSLNLIFSVGGRSGFSPVYKDVWLAKYQQGTVHLSSHINTVSEFFFFYCMGARSRIGVCRSGPSESIPGHIKGLQIRALCNSVVSMESYGILKPNS